MYYLTNGDAVEVPGDPSVARFGVGQLSGYLFLARLDDEPRFVNNLDPLPGSPGCWDPWDSDVYIAWDLGSAILFPRGLELPKAPGYVNSAPESKVDGRLTWTFESTHGATFCVNEFGQVDWVKPYRPGPTRRGTRKAASIGEEGADEGSKESVRAARGSGRHCGAGSRRMLRLEPRPVSIATTASQAKLGRGGRKRGRLR
jgi:hypothetical protein